MKVSHLIGRLQEVVAQFGDLEVVVGEASSVLRDKIDVNVDSKGKYDNESWGDKIAIVQAYIVFGRSK